MMFEKADIVIHAARACIGTPHRHQGRLIKKGMDCAGLVIHAASAAGITLIDYKGYPSRPFDGMLKKMLDSQPHMHEIDIDQAKPGDVLLMRVTVAPQHLAILSYDQKIIHSYQNVGFVCEHDLDMQFKSTVVSVYRLNYV